MNLEKFTDRAKGFLQIGNTTLGHHPGLVPGSTVPRVWNRVGARKRAARPRWFAPVAWWAPEQVRGEVWMEART